MTESTLSFQPVNLENPRKNTWLKILLWGLLLYIVSLLVLFITVNPNLFPTVALIGNLLVPVTYVAFFYERRHLSHLTLPVTGFAFVYGGIVGVVMSSLLEPLFINSSLLVAFIAIGVIEESSKLLGVVAVARRMKRNFVMDGLVLGAAVGMGFAAMESLGYTFSALVNSGSLTASVGVTLVRGLFAPIGHGTWAAILASVLFQESTETHFRITFKVVFAFVGMVLLHSLWDGLPSVFSAIVGHGIDVVIGEAVVGGLGLLVLWLRFRAGLRLQAKEALEESSQIVGVPTPSLPEVAPTTAGALPSDIPGPEDITQKIWLQR